MDSNGFKKAGTYYLVGNLFNKGIAFLTVPVFTRILSTTDYGIVTTYNSWISIIAMVAGFALHMGVRMAFVDYRREIDDFMSSIILFTLVSSFGLIISIVSIAILLNINLNLLIIVLCLLQGISSAIVQDYTHYLMMQYRYRFRTVLMILPNLLSVVTSIMAILFVFKTDLYLGRIIPTALINIFFGMIVVAFVLNHGKIRINWEYVKYGLKISAPLIVHGISLNILSQSDRTMITWLADASQTGIYSLIYNFSMIATVITTALEGVWVPWFTNKMVKREISDINVFAKDYVNLITYAIVCLIFVAPEVVKILASADYWDGIVIIPPIVLSNYIIFMYTLYVNIEHFYKRTVYISINTLTAAVINIILNYIFIPYFGYVAAAYTTIVAYVVSLFMHASYAKKLEKELYPIKIFVRPLTHILFASIMFYVLMGYPLIRWTFMVIYFLAMLFRERNRLFILFPDLKARIKNKGVFV